MNKTSDNLLPILSITTAVIAIIISIKSCHVSEKALSLANKEYKQERSLLLKAEFKDSNDGITVKPTEDQMTFLDGTAYLPSAIYKEKTPIDPSGEFFHMGSVTSQLKEFISKEIPKKTGFAQISTLNLPLIIDSYYAVKGETYTDRSLYTLKLDAVVTDEEYKSPTLDLRGLIFIKRYSQEESIDQEILNKIIKNEAYIHIPPRTP